MTIRERLLPWGIAIGFGSMASILVAMEISANKAATAVAVSHRHTQARTDSQPVLKDDLANQKRDTGNSSETPNSSPDIGATVASAIESAVPTIEFVDADFHCPHCRTLEKTLAGMAVNVVKTTGGEERYPAIRYAGHTWYGALSRRQIELILQQYKPPVVPQAVSVGTIKVRSHVDAFLSLVKPGRNGPEIVVGSARILMPSKAEVTEEISPETYKRVYTGTKPVYVYGILSVPVSEMTMSRNKLRLIAGGWPVELAVE